MKIEIFDDKTNTTIKENGSIKYVLLGNHSDDNDDMNNPLLKKMLDKVISKWPRK